jgi:hypothetical protein
LSSTCGDPGLDVDDRYGVRDGVVDFARDPEPFGVDPRPRFFLAGPFCQLGTLLSFGGDDPPGPDGLAQGCAHHRRTDAEEHPADGGVWLDAARREQRWSRTREPATGGGRPRPGR